jgi:hypothetical protein
MNGRREVLTYDTDVDGFVLRDEDHAFSVSECRRTVTIPQPQPRAGWPLDGCDVSQQAVRG